MTPERGSDSQPNGKVRVGTLRTMDVPLMQWAVWLHLETDKGAVKQEPGLPSTGERLVLYESKAVGGNWLIVRWIIGIRA